MTVVAGPVPARFPWFPCACVGNGEVEGGILPFDGQNRRMGKAKRAHQFVSHPPFIKPEERCDATFIILYSAFIIGFTP
jgi:hypothetical protein